MDLKKEGKFNQAIEVLTQALQISRKTIKKDDKVQLFVDLSLLHWNMGRLKIFYDKINEALLLTEKFNLKEKQKTINNYIKIHKLYKAGKKYRSQGLYKESIKSFEKAVALSKKMKSEELEIKCLRQMSITYSETKKPDRFFALNKEALKIARKLNHKIEESRCLNNIGFFYKEKNKYSLALKHYEEALEIAEASRNIYDQSDYLNNIGVIYSDIGAHDKALEYLTRALRVDQKMQENICVSMDLNNIGITFRKKALLSGKKAFFYTALENLEESLKIAEKNDKKIIEVMALINIGTVYTDLKSYSEALRCLNLALKKAEEIENTEEISLIFNNIGIVYFQQQNYDLAALYYRKAINLAKKMKACQILWEAFFGLGQCHEKKERNYLAMDYYRKAINEIDFLRSQIYLDVDKSSYLRDKLKVYEYLLNLLYKLHLSTPDSSFDKEIFLQVEKIKARAFLESLEETEIDIRERLTPELKEKERKISNQISQIIFNLRKPDLSNNEQKQLLKKLEKKESEYLSLISRIKMDDPRFQSLSFSESYDIEKIQAELLNEKTAFIEYFLGEKRSFLFFITRRNFNLFPLDSRDEIKNSVKAYLKTLSHPGSGEFQGKPAARRLYQELLFPLKKQTSQTIECLVIIPDGILYLLPFETLIDENKYIIDKYSISYSLSSSALITLLKKKIKVEYHKSLLAFGNPVYYPQSRKDNQVKTNTEFKRKSYLSQGFKFAPLPYTEKEILAISQFFPKNRVEIYLRDEAKEETVKERLLKNYQIIHFACHSFLDEKFPFRSALVLTLDNDPKEDGFLQAREIFTLRLNTDLIVLSACQTGKGRIERGEGIFGLPRIFFYSGARSVLSTLWIINDKSTSKFMEYFYGYLLKGKNKTEALRSAKLKMINTQYAHPFYWAPFILSGAYR